MGQGFHDDVGDAVAVAGGVDDAWHDEHIGGGVEFAHAVMADESGQKDPGAQTVDADAAAERIIAHFGLPSCNL